MNSMWAIRNTIIDSSKCGKYHCIEHFIWNAIEEKKKQEKKPANDRDVACRFLFTFVKFVFVSFAHRRSAFDSMPMIHLYIRRAFYTHFTDSCACLCVCLFVNVNVINNFVFRFFFPALLLCVCVNVFSIAARVLKCVWVWVRSDGSILCVCVNYVCVQAAVDSQRTAKYMHEHENIDGRVVICRFFAQHEWCEKAFADSNGIRNLLFAHTKMHKHNHTYTAVARLVPKFNSWRAFSLSLSPFHHWM